MTIVDKFSFALNKGYRNLYQPTEVIGNPESGMSVAVSYFSISPDGHGGVDVAKEFGTEIVRDDNIDRYREVAKKKGDKGMLELMDRVETVLEEVRSGALSVDEMNVRLHKETENFYQTYIADETITQTYAPTTRSFISDKPKDPDDEFMHRRWLQQIDERIGATSEIPHENVRRMWGLD